MHQNLLFRVVKVQKCPKILYLYWKTLFCGLKAPNLRISSIKERNGQEYIILLILGEKNTNPASVATCPTFTAAARMLTKNKSEMPENAT